MSSDKPSDEFDVSCVKRERTDSDNGRNNNPISSVTSDTRRIIFDYSIQVITDDEDELFNEASNSDNHHQPMSSDEPPPLLDVACVKRERTDSDNGPNNSPISSVTSGTRRNYFDSSIQVITDHEEDELFNETSNSDTHHQPKSTAKFRNSRFRPLPKSRRGGSGALVDKIAEMMDDPSAQLSDLDTTPPTVNFPTITPSSSAAVHGVVPPPRVECDPHVPHISADIIRYLSPILITVPETQPFETADSESVEESTQNESSPLPTLEELTQNEPDLDRSLEEPTQDDPGMIVDESVQTESSMTHSSPLRKRSATAELTEPPAKHPKQSIQESSPNWMKRFIADENHSMVHEEEEVISFYNRHQDNQLMRLDDQIILGEAKRRKIGFERAINRLIKSRSRMATNLYPVHYALDEQIKRSKLKAFFHSITDEGSKIRDESINEEIKTIIKHKRFKSYFIKWFKHHPPTTTEMAKRYKYVLTAVLKDMNSTNNGEVEVLADVVRLITGNIDQMKVSRTRYLTKSNCICLQNSTSVCDGKTKLFRSVYRDSSPQSDLPCQKAFKCKKFIKIIFKKLKSLKINIIQYCINI